MIAIANLVANVVALNLAKTVATLAVMITVATVIFHHVKQTATQLVMQVNLNLTVQKDLLVTAHVTLVTVQMLARQIVASVMRPHSVKNLFHVTVLAAVKVTAVTVIAVAIVQMQIVVTTVF
jgi:hypothetical protein